MGKIFNFVLITAGILLLMAVAGFGTLTGGVLDNLGVRLSLTDTSSPPISIPTGVIIGVLAALLTAMFAASRGMGGSVTIGGYVATRAESALVAGVITSLMTWMIMDLVSVMKISDQWAGDPNLRWISFVTYMIVIPMIAALIFAMVQFWRGNDI